MSDLFVGELILLSLLIPPLLRPFFERLRPVSGIAALPALALLLGAAVLAGTPFNLSLFPALLMTLLVFLVTLPRLYRLAAGLPSDWFDVGIRITHGFLLILFMGAAWASWRYAPELAWSPPASLEAKSRELALTSVYNASVREVWASGEAAPARGTGSVILLRTSFEGERSTAVLALAAEGYRVFDVEIHGPGLGVSGGAGRYGAYASTLLRSLPLPALESVRGSGFPGRNALREGDLAALAAWVRAQGEPGAPVFMIAEGIAAAAVLSGTGGGTPPFEGIVCLLPEGFDDPEPGRPAMRGIDDFMPSGAASRPVLAVAGGTSDGYGLGEIGANDPLAAALAGIPRDAGRKRAELAARRAASFFDLRMKTIMGESHDDQGS